MTSKLTLPLDFTGLLGDGCQATALLNDKDEREYLLRGPPEAGEQWGPLLMVCHSEAQLHMLSRGARMKKGEEEKSLQEFLWRASGELMSRRVHSEDFYDSGRENMGYELAWLPGSAYDQIVNALERSGQHGLAALMREGRVELPE